MKKFQIKEYSVIPPPYGGVSVYLYRLIRRLNEDGISTGGYYLKECNDSEILNSQLFDCFEWDNNMSGLKKIVLHVSRILKAVQHYEVIHIHGQELIYLHALMLLFRRVKIVVTVHNSMIVNFYYKSSFFTKWGLRYLAEQDVQWIAVSQESKQELLKLPFSFRNDIEVIPAYIPDDDSCNSLPHEMIQYISSHKKNISFYGRSFMMHNGEDVYGFKTIIRAYSGIKSRMNLSVGLVLCISDTSNSERIKELRNYASEFEVENDIFWQIGGIKGIKNLWHLSDLYIRPTSTDGDSVAVRDAIAEGAYVIASDVCIRPDEVVLYRYNDDNDLINKSLAILQQTRRKAVNVETFYKQMKDIYIKELSK